MKFEEAAHILPMRNALTLELPNKMVKEQNINLRQQKIKLCQPDNMADINLPWAFSVTLAPGILPSSEFESESESVCRINYLLSS